MLLSFEKIIKVQCIFLILVTARCGDCVEFYTEKPDWLKSCKIYQPGFTKCSTESIDGLMRYVTNQGFPELTEKFGPIDPFKLKEISLKGDNAQAVTISANLTDTIIKGFSKMVIKESRVSKKDFSWQTKIYVPKLRIDGKYKMAGKILLIPLNGAGDIFIDIDKLDIVAHTKTRLYEKGGFTFYNVTEVKVNLQVGNLHTYLENIFNGNSKDVEKSTNEFFNENWRDFFEALRPLISESIESVLTQVMKELFHLLPANFIVEDIPTSTELYSKKT